MHFEVAVVAVRLARKERLELAARTLGAGRLRTFFTITLPLAWPGLVTGALLAFARALGEFGATITFVSNIPGETRTLPLAIYTALQTPGGETEAAKLSLISIVLADAWELCAARGGHAPLLLLDEIAAHLDGVRRAALFDSLKDAAAVT